MSQSTAEPVFTWSDLEKLVAGKPASEIHLAILRISSYADFIAVVNDSIDFALRDLVRNRELRHRLDENQLSIQVVSFLRALSLDATHDTKIGGHCDLIIQGPRDYLWLGEAKKHTSDYSWLFKGFQQLCARYSTGLAGQDEGGMIIFACDSRSDRIMERWREYLSNNYPAISCADIEPQNQTFISHHTHDGTGRQVKTRHAICPLYFNPTDNQ